MPEKKAPDTSRLLLSPMPGLLSSIVVEQGQEQVLLEIINASSGVNFASLNRFPKIIHGDYLKGGLTNALMMKDVTLYTDLAGILGIPSVNASAPLAAFGLAIGLGYGNEISNTVVDAIGDVSGGVRLHSAAEDEPTEPTRRQSSD